MGILLVRDISNQIDFILGLGFLNNESYMMTSIESGEVNRKFQELLNIGLKRECESLCCTYGIVARERWRMEICTRSMDINKITIK